MPQLWAMEIKLTASPGSADMDRLSKTADMIGAASRFLISKRDHVAGDRRRASCNLKWLLEFMQRWPALSRHFPKAATVRSQVARSSRRQPTDCYAPTPSKGAALFPSLVFYACMPVRRRSRSPACHATVPSPAGVSCPHMSWKDWSWTASSIDRRVTHPSARPYRPRVPGELGTPDVYVNSAVLHDEQWHLIKAAKGGSISYRGTLYIRRVQHCVENPANCFGQSLDLRPL